MNDDPLHDPGLDSFAGRLSGLRPQLAGSESKQLLYACAFAAGEAAARLAGARRMRCWMGATSLLAVVSLTLGLQVMQQTDRTLTTPQGRSVAAQEEPAAPDTRPAVVVRDDEESGQLSVVASLDQVVDFDWPPPPAVERTRGAAGDDDTEPVLTPLSRILPDSVVN
jgi:hypothetical protein